MLFCPNISLPFGDDVVIRNLKAGSHQRSFVSLHTSDTRTGFRAANVRDSFAADVNQVPCRKHSHRIVIYTYEVCRKPGQASIDQHVRRLLLFDPEEEIDSRAAGGNDQGIQPACQQMIDLLLL